MSGRNWAAAVALVSAATLGSWRGEARAAAQDDGQVMVVRPDGRVMSGRLASPAMRAELRRSAPAAAPGTVVVMQDGMLRVMVGGTGPGSLAERIARSLGG